MPQNMDLETVVKIEAYSVKDQEENDSGQAQSDEIESAVFNTPGPLLPGPCSLQNYDSTLPTPIPFHSEIGSASNCKRKINADESPLTMTNDVNEGSSRKEEASTEEKYKCSIPNCSKSFANKRKLNAHLKYEHRQNWFTCQMCGSSFSENLTFKNHLLDTHYNRQPYACNVCSKSFKYIESLRKHERKIHQITQETTQKSRSENQSPIQNSESGKIVMLKPAPTPILIPAKISLPVSSKEVPPEGVEFVLKNHLATHATAQPYVCNVCSKLCEDMDDLRKHEQEVHQITQMAPQKSRSEKQLSSQRSESTKIAMIRTTPRPIFPKIALVFSVGVAPSQDVVLCSESSTEKSELVNNHEPDQLLKTQAQMSTATTTLSSPDSTNEIETESVLVGLTSSSKAPLLKVNSTKKCDVCFKDFKSHDSLVNHKRHVHTAENEKGYKCYICPKSFAVRPSLKNHLYFIHGEKSKDLKIFECEFCGRQFRCVSNLEAHIVAMHVVDKEFKCSICSKTFIDQDALTKHQVKIHEQKILNYFCDVCSARFTSRKVLGYHLRNVHKKLFCCKCVRSFKNKSKFNQHSNSEATPNLNAGFKLQCQICFVSLSTQCNFNIHTDGHLREKKSTVVA